MKKLVLVVLLIVGAGVVINGLSVRHGSHLDRGLRFGIQQPYNAGRKIGGYVHESVQEERRDYGGTSNRTYQPDERRWEDSHLPERPRDFDREIEGMNNLVVLRR